MTKRRDHTTNNNINIERGIITKKMIVNHTIFLLSKALLKY